jgi:hypothetical protein
MITREHRRRNRYSAHHMRQRGRSLDDIAGHLRVTKRSVMRYLAEPDSGEPATPKPAAHWPIPLTLINAATATEGPRKSR